MCSGQTNSTMTVKTDPQVYGEGTTGDENARKAYGIPKGGFVPRPPSVTREGDQPLGKEQDLADLLAQQASAKKFLEARQGRGRKSAFLTDYVKENTTLTSMAPNTDTVLGG